MWISRPSEQDKQRQELYSLLGDLPPRDGPIAAQLLDQGERDGYLLEKLLLELNGSEPVPAYFVKPVHSSGRLPCLLYNHAHGGDYRWGRMNCCWAVRSLALPLRAGAYIPGLGGAVYRCLGIRQNARGRTKSQVFKEMLWKGQVLWGKMVYDGLRALDYLGRVRMWMEKGLAPLASPWAARWPGGLPRWTPA